MGAAVAQLELMRGTGKRALADKHRPPAMVSASSVSRDPKASDQSLEPFAAASGPFYFFSRSSPSLVAPVLVRVLCDSDSCEVLYYEGRVFGQTYSGSVVCPRCNVKVRVRAFGFAFGVAFGLASADLLSLIPWLRAVRSRTCSAAFAIAARRLASAAACSACSAAGILGGGPITPARTCWWTRVRDGPMVVCNSLWALRRSVSLLYIRVVSSIFRCNSALLAICRDRSMRVRLRISTRLCMFKGSRNISLGTVCFMGFIVSVENRRHTSFSALPSVAGDLPVCQPRSGPMARPSRVEDVLVGLLPLNWNSRPWPQHGASEQPEREEGLHRIQRTRG